MLGLTIPLSQIYLTTKKRGAYGMAPPHSSRKGTKSPYSVLQAVPSRPSEASGRNLIRDKSRKRIKVAKVESWSPMDLPVKWHFLEYKFDMK